MVSQVEEKSAADCAKVANARVAGMGQDLRLDIGSRYTTALLVFFIAHLFFGVGSVRVLLAAQLTWGYQLPSNILLCKVGTANWLAFIAFSWGTVMLGQVWTSCAIGLAPANRSCRYLHVPS